MKKNEAALVSSVETGEPCNAFSDALLGHILTACSLILVVGGFTWPFSSPLSDGAWYLPSTLYLLPDWEAATSINFFEKSSRSQIKNIL